MKEIIEWQNITVFQWFVNVYPTSFYDSNGDEIGMSYERLKNKDGGYCRNGARTPMQWSAEKNAGFSEGDGEMYLPIYNNYKEVNVEARLNEEGSLIKEVQKLVEIKRA